MTGALHVGGRFRHTLSALGLVALAVTLAGCAGTPARNAAPNGESAHTLAVLPFTAPNLVPDTNWFTTGFTRELTSTLGHNPYLRVTAWRSALRFRDSAASSATIGSALGVHDLLRGTLTGAGDQIVFFVKLVDARDGRTVWSGSFSGATPDLAASEAAIAQQVARALSVGTAPPRSATNLSPKAHAILWHAQALNWNSRAHVKQARMWAKRAVTIDPHYAEAYAVIAATWMHVAMNQPASLRAAAAIPNVKSAARKALALDPDNADALYALGNAYYYGNQLQQAAAEYQHAVGVDPSYAAANYALGDLAHSLPDALRDFKAAVQLEPYNADAQNNLADTYLDLGQYRHALRPAMAYHTLQPNNVDAAFLLALNQALLGHRRAAVAAFERRLAPFTLAQRLDAAGKLTYESLLTPALHAQAAAAVAALGDPRQMAATSQGDVMQLQLALGEHAQVLAELPSLCASSAVSCSDLGSFPQWQPLHGNPKFAALVRQYDTLSHSGSGTL